MSAARTTTNVAVSPDTWESDNVPNNKKAGRPPNPEGENKPLATRPKPRVRAALARYKADQDLDVTDSQVLAAALEEFLETRGYLKENDK